MSHQYPYQPASGQHDTSVLPPPATGQAPYSAPSGWLPPAAEPANPEAEYWAARFRRQRRWTRALAALLVAGGLLVVGGGVVVWKAVSAGVGSLTAAQGSVSDGSGSGSGSADDVPALPESGEGPTDGTAPDVSDVPLPEQLRGLGSMLGVDNLEDVLDAAVANGLLSAEQADQIRLAVKSGQSLAGLEGMLGGQG